MLAANDAEALPRGGELCRQAIAADPSFAPAYSLFSRMAWMRIALGRSEDREADVRQAVEYGRRALELDDRLEMAHCAIGQALALAGRPEDGRRALDRAQALNPNSAYVQLACALGELFRESPDTERIERCALTSLRLDPNGSGNWGNHTMIGLARFWRNFDWTNPDVREPMEASAASANVDWFPPIYAALANASIGRDDVAARYVQQALAIRPDITVATWRRAFDFPMWARNVAASEPYLPKLIEMGLPAE